MWAFLYLKQDQTSKQHVLTAISKSSYAHFHVPRQGMSLRGLITFSFHQINWWNMHLTWVPALPRLQAHFYFLSTWIHRTILSELSTTSPPSAAPADKTRQLKTKKTTKKKGKPIGNICKSMTWIHACPLSLSLSPVSRRSYRRLFTEVSIWQEWRGHNHQRVCSYMIYYWLSTSSQHVLFIYFLDRVAYRTFILW